MENRGGKRKGSGRKPKQPPDYDLKFKKKILSAANKLAKKYDKPLEEAVLELVYDANTQDAVKAAIWKTFVEMFTVKKTERKEEINVKQGPRIGLPPIRRQDPALEVVKGGK